MSSYHLMSRSYVMTIFIMSARIRCVRCPWHEVLYIDFRHGKPFEFDFDYSPAWLFVGQYMHWTPRLDAIADEYVRRAIGMYDEKTATPPVRFHYSRCSSTRLISP